MRSIRGILLAVPLVVACGLLFGQSNGEPDVATRVAALEASVEALQAELAQVQSELKELRSRQVVAPPGYRPDLPPGSTEHESGGIRYYIVPLEKKGSEKK